MEKHELYLVTSTCTMSGNVMLLDCARHKPGRLIIIIAARVARRDRPRGSSGTNRRDHRAPSPGVSTCFLGVINVYLEVGMGWTRPNM
jgi:hypothetical protein